MKGWNHFPGDEKLYRSMQEAHCKSDIDSEWESYRKKRSLYLKLSLCGILFSAVMLAGVIFYKIPLERDSIVRPDYGQEDISYNFYSENTQGENESIHLEVSARTYTEKEAEERFDSYFEKLQKNILDKNTSYKNINKNLNFSGLEGFEDVSLSFYTSDMDLIGDDGCILTEGHEAGSYEITIYIQMNCGEYQKNFEINADVQITEDSVSYEQFIENLEDKNKEKKYIEIPESYQGKEYFLYEKIPWSNAAALICILITVLIYKMYAQQAAIKELCKKRKLQMEADYPMLLSRLMILIRAGLSVKKAWYKITADYEKSSADDFHYAIEEMILTRQEIESGISEKEAYLRFGKRCGLPGYIKLGSLLEQNIRKGSQGMLGLIESERIIALENRKQQVKAAGEIAGSQLMMPMMILFALVMAVIMVPALMSFNM